jgi:hypothetical protein
MNPSSGSTSTSTIHRAGCALKDVQNGPHVCEQDQHAQDSAYLHEILLLRLTVAGSGAVSNGQSPMRPVMQHDIHAGLECNQRKQQSQR